MIANQQPVCSLVSLLSSSGGETNYFTIATVNVWLSSCLFQQCNYALGSSLLSPGKTNGGKDKREKWGASAARPPTCQCHNRLRPRSLLVTSDGRGQFLCNAFPWTIALIICLCLVSWTWKTVGCSQSIIATRHVVHFTASFCSARLKSPAGRTLPPPSLHANASPACSIFVLFGECDARKNLILWQCRHG